MAMGRQKAEQQQDLFVMADALPKSVGHVFCIKLNQLLAEGGFDAWVEQLCEPYYSNGTGRHSIPPSVYFRMQFVVSLVGAIHLLRMRQAAVKANILGQASVPI